MLLGFVPLVSGAEAGLVPLASAVGETPALAAAAARVEAARARLGSSGRFPDPSVEAMAATRNMPGDDMRMWELRVVQPLPKKGERAADRDRAEAVLAMAESAYALMAGEMAAEVAMRLAEAETAGLRAKILGEQIARAEKALSSIDARLASGQGRLGDRLALQTRIAAMRLMIEEDAFMAANALSDARGLLGRGPAGELPAFAAPEGGAISADESAQLRMAAARRGEAQAMGRMARASAKPMTAVALRFEQERERMGTNDTVGIGFMTELPWRSRRYAVEEERAAEAEGVAALAEAESARYRIAVAISRVGRAERLAVYANQVASETQARLDAEYEALVSSVGAGGMGSESPVLMLLELLERSTEAQLQAVEADGAARVARAGLWRFAPVGIFQIQ